MGGASSILCINAARTIQKGICEAEREYLGFKYFSGVEERLPGTTTGFKEQGTVTGNSLLKPSFRRVQATTCPRSPVKLG